MNSKLFEIPGYGYVDIDLDSNLTIAKEFDLISAYRDLFNLRLFELKCAKLKETSSIGGPVHLAVGQEAVALGVSASLNSNDFVFSAHRSHTHLLSMSKNYFELFAEILGRESSLSGGYGGSMHLTDQNSGFYGSVPIVAGTVPIAVGAAFAAKYNDTDSIAVSYFGDGALEEGVIQESLNLASKLKLPILFVCENNYMASHMHLSERQPSGDLTRFATANNIESIRLDGNNILTIFEEMKNIISEIRITKNPFFVEALTFRHLGHVDWREDIDVGVNRSMSELQSWKTIDPILRLRNLLKKMQFVSETDLVALEQELTNQMEQWAEMALRMPSPNASGILSKVYSD